jgi:hypothetical protein
MCVAFNAFILPFHAMLSEEMEAVGCRCLNDGDAEVTCRRMSLDVDRGGLTGRIDDRVQPCTCVCTSSR